MKTAILTTFITLALFAAACKKKSTPRTFNCTGTTPTYNLNVKALMDAHCATSGCHSASNKADGKDLSNYASTKSVALNDSFLGSIDHLSGYNSMPQGAAKLNEADITTIACWIQNGMPE